MNRRHTVLLAAILAMPVAAGGDRIQPTSHASIGANAPAFAAGQVLVLDSSGKISAGAPRAADLRAVLGDAISTSGEGLVEEKSPVQGGGVMVNLQGRFQNAMTIEKDANGNITAPCVSGTPADSEAGEVE